MAILCGLALVLLIVGSGVYYMVSRITLMDRVRSRWEDAGYTIHMDPVPVRLRTRGLGGLRSLFVSHTFGALGLVENRLVFTEVWGDGISILFTEIRWIGLRTFWMPDDPRTHPRRAVILHVQIEGQWRVLSFFLKDDHHLCHLLSRRTGLPVVETTRCNSIGPISVTAMRQDVYGNWMDKTLQTLFLAPDHLVIGGAEALPLAWLRRVDVYTREGLAHAVNPFADDLLRVQYETPDGTQLTRGFEFWSAQMWGRELGKQARVPFEIHTGRKKK